MTDQVSKCLVQVIFLSGANVPVAMTLTEWGRFRDEWLNRPPRFPVIIVRGTEEAELAVQLDQISAMFMVSKATEPRKVQPVIPRIGL